MKTYGYIRTSRQRIQGTAGSDPEAQAHQLRQEGVPEANIPRRGCLGRHGHQQPGRLAGPQRQAGLRRYSGGGGHRPDRLPLDGHHPVDLRTAGRGVKIKSLADAEKE